MIGNRTKAAGSVAAVLWMSALWGPAPGAHAQVSPAPRIAPLPASDWRESVRTAAQALSATGMTELVGTYAHHPVLAEALLPHLAYVLTGSTLPPRDRALLGLRTAWLMHSDYLWSHRAALARGDGLTDEELERVARGPDAAGWSSFDATLLHAADELIVDAFISDATWAVLAARYDLPRLIDAIDTVGALTMHAGAINSLRIAIEPGFTDRLPNVPYAVAAERTNIRLLGREPRIPPTPPADGGPITANVFFTFVHNPPADRVRGAINAHVNGRSTLDPRQRELLLMRIGILCRAEYEYAAHHRAGRRAGLTDADVAMILAGPEAGEGDPIMLALLAATDELHRDGVVADDTWSALAAAFDRRQLLDMLFAVGAYRSGSMLISSAGVQLDANMADFRFPPELRQP